VGGKKVVSGMRMAMAEEGPMPGRTPTRVPMRQPISAQKRLRGPNAAPKPWIKRSQEKFMKSLPAKDGH